VSEPSKVDPGAELVEVVDEAGRVIDVVTRRRMRAERLRHRCTYVAVIDSSRPETSIVVHKRAAWKDTYPSYWDIAFGGVCDVGESWPESAARELAEEAGIAGVELQDLGPVSYEAADGAVVGRVFVVRWDGPVRFDDGEVVAIDRVPLATIDDWASQRQVCPDSQQLVIPLLQQF
jgi:isopentenyl-diphosphate delta-isomerase